MKHELVHVITLQQTEFNIPHWYTEALAVQSEGFPRPQPWNKMLVERDPRPGRSCSTSTTINLGFIRPDEPEDRQLAYCQAQLYAQYMPSSGSAPMPTHQDARRLQAEGSPRTSVIDECFHVAKDDFEAKYLDFLDQVVKTIQTRAGEEKPVKFSELEKPAQGKPRGRRPQREDGLRALRQARPTRLAKPFADKALKLKPQAADGQLRQGPDLRARSATMTKPWLILEPALDPAKPDTRVLDLLGRAPA